MQMAVNVPNQPWRLKEVYLEKMASLRRVSGRWVALKGRERKGKGGNPDTGNSLCRGLESIWVWEWQVIL